MDEEEARRRLNDRLAQLDQEERLGEADLEPLLSQCGVSDGNHQGGASQRQ